MSEKLKDRLNKKGREQETNDDRFTLEQVNEYFDIDITEREADYLIKVTRKSDGKNMLIYMGICEFPNYIDWWYGMEVVPADDDTMRYALKKGPTPISKPDPELSDVQEIHLWVEMFICEHPYAFKR